MINPYQVTKDFEVSLSKYTGAPFVITTDNMSNGLFLVLKYLGIEGEEITIPSRTYMSVPCAIAHAGGKIKFDNNYSQIISSLILGTNNFSVEQFLPRKESFHK